jgi:ferrous iron transport protein A
MVTLVEFSEGESARVVSIEGGSDIVKRLYHLGIREGVKIKKLVGMSRKGPIIVKISHSQVALGRGMASRIMVDPIEE